jgi:hypothetical protein
MSGSPILNGDGAAIGLISTGSEGRGKNFHPSLEDCLPSWLWRELSCAPPKRAKRVASS